jgi:hypothetical protein
MAAARWPGCPVEADPSGKIVPRRTLSGFGIGATFMRGVLSGQDRAVWAQGLSRPREGHA